MSFGAIAVGVGSAAAGSLVSGAMSGGGSGGATQQVTNEPWSGIQPYLTGDTGPASRFQQPLINYNNMLWSQQMAKGAEPSVAPPMFMSDPRMTGQNVAVPTDALGNPIYRGATPDFSGGPMGQGFGGQGIDLQEQMKGQLGQLPQGLLQRQADGDQGDDDTAKGSYMDYELGRMMGGKPSGGFAPRRPPEGATEEFMRGWDEGMTTRRKFDRTQG